MANLNYAKEYSSALSQAFGYTLNFGALYGTENNSKYRFSSGKTIEIPNIKTTGRVAADRDIIATATRNYNNLWESKTLANQRKWSTLVHPADISQTNMVASIQNITQVYNEEQKFPEMDAYLISKLYADWTAAGKSADTTVLTTENILAKFDSIMQEMTEERVPSIGRIMYVTPAVNTIIRNAKEISRTINVKDIGGSLNRTVTDIDSVEIVVVPSTLMKTAYNFTEGWSVEAAAKQINMLLIHPSAIITPVSYQFAQLDEPTAGSEGKYVYYEESFEDVFILNNKTAGIAFNVEA